LNWGGFRGGNSVALALSLPSRLDGSAAAARDAILTMTYIVVTFSIIVEGLSIGALTQRWHAEGSRPDAVRPSDERSFRLDQILITKPTFSNSGTRGAR
jgi:monovalent cation:H+ antiporter, CPA1 family